MVRLSRLVLAAPASGQGKTTVAVGLMAALTRLGRVVAPAKVGPDYIDPGYHHLATGRPGRNLDPWLTSPELLVPLLLRGALAPVPADIALIEGVMGLFDGQLGTDGFASTAQVATITRSPVLLVVDISSAARTVAAMVHGLRTFAPEVTVVGVVLNKAGSSRHADEVRRAVEGSGLPVVGVLPRDAGISAPSRHLGLVPSAERADAAASLDRLAEQTAQHLDLDLVLDLARRAPDLDGSPWTPPEHGAGRVPRVVAVAGGRAFTFRYTETEELLLAAGCEPVIFDPTTDASLPSGTCGLYLGGGFPEVHAAALASNTALLQEVREAVTAGMPTVAECAGMLYLAQTLDGHRMAGALPTTAAMGPRLTLRYRTATLPVDGVLGPGGTVVHAHEFHRTRTSPPFIGPGAWHVGQTRHGFALDPAGTGTPTVHASYLHTHWAGAPSLAASFADAVHTWAARPSTARTPTFAATAPRQDRAEPGPEPRHTDPTSLLDHHGDAEVRGSDLVDLAVNVRRQAPPSWLAREIIESVDSMAAYPDIAAARAALAARHQVAEEAVLPTAGATEAFTLIARAMAGRHPLVVHPQFTEPEAALRRAGRVPTRHLLGPATGFSLDPWAVDPSADLVVVGNPTNPTGVLHPRASLEALRCPGRILVVDEAFIDTIPGEPESLLQGDLTDVLVLRSLTKTWGVAGIRAGYVVGDPRLVRELVRHQQPWSVSTPAAVVMAATSQPGPLAEAEMDARRAVEDRAYLMRGLTSLGLQPVPGRAPFVLVEVGSGIREALRDIGYAVRRGDTFPGLSPAWVRIAVRDRAVTDGLMAALGKVLNSTAQRPDSYPAPEVPS